jgi:hypothetical protein
MGGVCVVVQFLDMKDGDELEAMLEEIDAVTNLPKPWNDCICAQVSGDNELCVIHHKKSAVQ